MRFQVAPRSVRSAQARPQSQQFSFGLFVTLSHSPIAIIRARGDIAELYAVNVFPNALDVAYLRSKTQRNLTDQQLDSVVRRLSYCLGNERTSGNGYSYVCVGRSVESD
jgi:hypothetical protein